MFNATFYNISVISWWYNVYMMRLGTCIIKIPLFRIQVPRFKNKLLIIQSSRRAPVLRPKSSTNLFGPVNFSVFIQNYSETCLNRTPSKPKTCLNRTPSKPKTCLNRNLSKSKTFLNQTDITVPYTKCLCNLNLCKPNTVPV